MMTYSSQIGESPRDVASLSKLSYVMELLPILYGTNYFLAKISKDVSPKELYFQDRLVNQTLNKNSSKSLPISWEFLHFIYSRCCLDLEIQGNSLQEYK